MWYLSIIISIILVIISTIYLNILYSKFNNEWGLFGAASIAHTFNTFHPSLSINPKFKNITANIILKTIIFIIIAFIIHATDSLTLTNFYVLLVLFNWWVFNRRRKEINSLSEENKQMFKAYVFKSYITIPIFQTILYLLCFVTYRLNY